MIYLKITIQEIIIVRILLDSGNKNIPKQIKKYQGIISLSISTHKFNNVGEPVAVNNTKTVKRIHEPR